MESQRYAQLNPLAAAVAAGTTALFGYLLIGLPMAGMMGSYYGRWGMGYGWHPFAFMWMGGIFTAALAGAIFAWVYNAVNGGRKARPVDRGTADRGTGIQPT